MIKIEMIKESNSKLLNKVDNSFTTDKKIIPIITASNNLDYCIESLSIPIEKPWEQDDKDAKQYIEYNESTAFFAYYYNELVGQIILQKSWNNFCFIEDLRVSKKTRRQGIGKILMNKAIEWSLNKKLAGLRLETQDINVNACKFYKAMGFSLKGFDQCLYHSIPNSKKEVALYWYLIHSVTNSVTSFNSE